MPTTIASIRAPEMPLPSGTPYLFFMATAISHSLVSVREGFKFSSCSCRVSCLQSQDRKKIWYRKVEGLMNGLDRYLCSCSLGQNTCLSPCDMHRAEETFFSSALGTAVQRLTHLHINSLRAQGRCLPSNE